MARRGQIAGWSGSAALHFLAACLVLAIAHVAPQSETPLVFVELPEPADEPSTEAAPEVPVQTATEVPSPPEPMQPTAAASLEPLSAEAEPERPEPLPQAEEIPPPQMQQAEVTPAEPEPPPQDVSEAQLPLPPPSMPPPPRLMRAMAPPSRPVALPSAPVPVPEATPAAAAASAPARHATSAPSPSYIARLLAALERQKRYPDEARGRHAEGIALLRFRMQRDGSVIGARIERSAGDTALDEAVLAMIRRASPLPAPPAEMPGDTLELTVPVRFALR